MVDYTNPNTVVSPKKKWELKKVIFDGGVEEWSAAEGSWLRDDDKWEDVLAIRWNGGAESKIGTPQSRGFPTWFIVPPELRTAIRNKIVALKKK